MAEVSLSPLCPLSVVVPTLDEERHIGACLDSAGFAAERLVIDSGSRDRTVALAEARGARVLVRPFTGWGEQRNHAVSQARHDWVLCLDADERVTPELAREITTLLGQTPALHGYRIARAATFAGRRVRHGGWGRDFVLRLYDRRHGAWDLRRVHEKVVLDGPAGELAGELLHHTARDLFHQADKERRYALLGAEELFAGGRRAGALDVLLRPALRFVKMYGVQRGFLDGTTGALVAGLAAYGVFLKYGRLAELSSRTQPKETHEMAISPELLEILACPLCKVPVRPTADQSGLECESCHRIYPVRDDIPVMLVEEARVRGQSNEPSSGS